MAVLDALWLDACELPEAPAVKVVKTLDRQNLNAVRKSWSNLKIFLDWQSRFTPEFAMLTL